MSWACLRVAAACLTPAVCPGSTASLVPPAGEAELGPRLLRGRSRPGGPGAAKSVGRQPGDHLAAAHGRADVHQHPLEPAGDLEAELGLLVGGERAGDLDRPRQLPLLGGGEPHLARGAGGLAVLALLLPTLPFLPRGRGIPSAPRQQRRQGKSRRQKIKELPQDNSPLESSAESREMGTLWHPAGFNPISRAEIPPSTGHAVKKL